MAETDLADWLTVDDTAARIGCSKRTVERLGRARKLEQRLRRQEGTPPVAVYNPDDVDRIAQERRPAPAPFVLPATSTPTNGNGHGRALSTQAVGIVTHPAEDLIRHVFALAVQALQSPPSPPNNGTVAAMAESANPFLTVAEAAAYRHVSERLVLRWIRTGHLDAEREPRSLWTAKDRGWRIRRKDLEAL